MTFMGSNDFWELDFLKMCYSDISDLNLIFPQTSIKLRHDKSQTDRQIEERVLFIICFNS